MVRERKKASELWGARPRASGLEAWEFWGSLCWKNAGGPSEGGDPQ